MEFKRISNYDLNIRYTVNGGIIAKVGCAEFAFSNPEDMMDVMKQYYENPDGMEKEYNQSSANEVRQEAETETSRPSQAELRGPAGASGSGVGSVRSLLSEDPDSQEEQTEERALPNLHATRDH